MKTPEQLSLEDAQKIAEESDYAFAASETDCNPINWGDAAAFVLEGYKACFAELTRWNDPKEVLPEPNKDVLVKCSSGQIQTDFYAPELGGFFIEHSTYAKVIGWREMM